MVEAAYFGATFERPFPERLPWWDDDAPTDADLWVTQDESRQDVVELYRRAAAHADATIEELALDSPGRVSWWRRPEVTLHQMLVHVLAETSRHAGHADILREQLDGQAGLHPDFTNLPEQDAARAEQHWARVEAAAKSASAPQG